MLYCKAERYINNVYAGMTTLYFPEFSSNVTSTAEYSEYSNVKSDLGTGSGTSFYIAPYFTTFQPDVHVGFPVNRTYDLWAFTGGGSHVPVFEFKLITNDNHDRRIRVTGSNLHDDPTTSNPCYRYMDLSFSFIIDGSTKYTHYGIQHAQRYVQSGAYYTIEYSWIDSIPFISTDLNAIIISGYQNRSVQNVSTGAFTYYSAGIVSKDTNTSNVNNFKAWLQGADFPVYDEENPYIGGGTSDEGGGDGNFSEDSDDPITDDLPTIDAVGTGFATLFTPSRAQLKNLSGLFWNSNVFTFLQNLVENITDMFVSLAMVPFQVTAGSTVSVTWLGIDTAVSLTLAASQFYEFNMGTIDLSSDSRIFTSGSALDYSPFSTLGIYLPFIGYRELDIDECREASVNLRYRIDILSGSCVAIIRVAGRDIYEFTGNCLTQIPITNENMQSLVSDAVNVGLAINNAQAAEAAAGATVDAASAKGKPLTDDKAAHLEQAVERSEGSLASATANAAMGMKPHYAKSGAVSGSVAMMSVKQPYLFLRTPRQCIPDHYQRYCGFPSNITGKLGDFSGYTVVEDIRLNGLVATSPEVAEIYRLLKSGVII